MDKRSVTHSSQTCLISHGPMVAKACLAGSSCGDLDGIVKALSEETTR
jgi:hypothetical protein